MKDFLVEKQQYRIWVETSLDKLEVGDVFRISSYLNHLNDYVPCLDGCGCSEWTVIGEKSTHPIYGLCTIPVRSSLRWIWIEKLTRLGRKSKIKFIGEGYIIISE